MSLLRTAEQGAEREDWKLVIDSIQRILESPEGLMETTAGQGLALYESPRRRALRYLADLPPEALEAYRLLYDGRAKGLLEQARRDHDLALLRGVVDHYLLTRSGLEAGRLLSGWLLDFGRPGESLLVIEELESIGSAAPGGGAMGGGAMGGGGLDYRLLGVKAAALAMVGAEEAAFQAVNAFAESARLAESGRLAGVGSTESLEKALRDMATGRLEGAASESGGDWASIGGGGACRGVMDAVVPSFASGMPWRHELSGGMRALWGDPEEVGPRRLPVCHGVARDGRLYVRASDHVAAIDVQSFALLWRSRRVTGETQGDDGDGPEMSEQDMLVDSVSGGLSVGGELVLTVEGGDERLANGGTSAVASRRFDRRRPAFGVQNTDQRNRVVAFDALTGDVRWQRGRDLDEDDRLRHAEFLAVPVLVGEHFWVPYKRGGDLYLGALRGEDGGLVRETPLCTLGNRGVNYEAALHMAVAGGLCYLPTGHGMLFAVNAHDGSIRWASRYGESRMLPRYRGGRQQEPIPPTEWLTSAPMVTGHLVLLAPSEEDRLLAFDRFSGALLWSMPREEHDYLIAADETTLWLAGAKVSALSLVDQVYQWTTPLHGAMGRAAMCGETIYASTRSGLLRVDARTGASALEPLPSDQAPLGNLLCLGNSMISVDPVEARSFPDVHSFASAAEAHRSDPTNVRLGMRLAFMELLGGNPKGALEALAEAEIPDSAEGDILARHVSGLRVDAMLRLASSPATSIDDSLAYLREADEIAFDMSDKVSARLALGDRLRRVGRFREAYEVLLELALSDMGDVMSSNGPVSRPARLVAADALKRIEPELSPDEAKALSGRLSEVFGSSVGLLEGFRTRREGSEALRRMGECGALEGWSQVALNALGSSELARGRFERAEQNWMESARLGSDRARTAEALLALAGMYLDPAQPLTQSAAEVLTRVDEEFGGVEVDGRRASLLAAGLRERLAGMGAPVSARQEAFELMDRTLFPDFEESEEAVELLTVRHGVGEFARERVLTFTAPRTLRSFDISDGTMEWESELLLLASDVYGVSDAGVNELMGSRFPAQAVSDGQTLILNGPEGVHGVGAISGVRLWAERVEGLSLLSSRGLRDELLSAGSGRLACVLERGVLSVRTVIDGSRIVWQRDLGVAPIGAVRVRDGFVLSADPEIERVHVYALDDGELLSALEFIQPDDVGTSRGALAIAYSDGVLCGPEGNGVVAYDASTGLERWRMALDSAPVAILEPTEGLVVISSSDGGHRMARMEDGSLVLDRRLEGVPTGATLGSLEGDVLVLAGSEDTLDGARWDVVGLNAETGESLWRTSFVGILTSAQLTLSDVVAPVIHTTSRSYDGDDSVIGRETQELRLLDKRTGEYVGSPIVWHGTEVANGLTGKMALWQGRLAAQAPKGFAVFETRPHRAGSDRVD